MFENADLIHRYSRADALRDGVFVDVSATAREAGIRFPVALTRAVWERCVSVPPGVLCQDEAGRLWDVAPDGSSQTLVARGLFRPSGSGRYVWQLNANGWRFAAGHVPKLELLGEDPPYARPSNGSFTIDVTRLQLRLPVRNAPDC